MYDDNFELEVKAVFDEMADLLKKKNASYGGSALKGEGILPLIGNQIRLGDKARRYEHMMAETVEHGGRIPVYFGESIEDTLKDILGYATLGLILIKRMKAEGRYPDKDAPDTTMDKWLKDMGITERPFGTSEPISITWDNELHDKLEARL